MEWLRWYHGAISDDKWPLIARKSGQSVAVVVAVWAALLECASQAEERGRVTGFDPESLDALFGLDDGTCQKVLDALCSGKKPRIAKGRLLKWTERQPKREDGSAERAKLWRERKKEAQAIAREETAGLGKVHYDLERTGHDIAKEAGTLGSMSLEERMANAVRTQKNTEQSRTEQSRTEQTKTIEQVHEDGMAQPTKAHDLSKTVLQSSDAQGIALAKNLIANSKKAAKKSHSKVAVENTPACSEKAKAVLEVENLYDMQNKTLKKQAVSAGGCSRRKAEAVPEGIASPERGMIARKEVLSAEGVGLAGMSAGGGVVGVDVSGVGVDVSGGDGNNTDLGMAKSDSIKRRSRSVKKDQEPGLEFQELREFYNIEARMEAPLAGFMEYRQLKGCGQWPGLGRIADAILAQQRADLAGWQRFAPGLGRFLREHRWLLEVHKEEVVNGLSGAVMPFEHNGAGDRPLARTQHQKDRQHMEHLARFVMQADKELENYGNDAPYIHGTGPYGVAVPVAGKP